MQLHAAPRSPCLTRAARPSAPAGVEAVLISPRSYVQNRGPRGRHAQAPAVPLRGRPRTPRPRTGDQGNESVTCVSGRQPPWLGSQGRCVALGLYFDVQSVRFRTFPSTLLATVTFVPWTRDLTWGPYHPGGTKQPQGGPVLPLDPL